MNSIWNKNKNLFAARFPDLSEMFKTQIRRFDDDDAFPAWSVRTAKNGSMTASENGIFLHSSYNPEREAVQAVHESEFGECTAAVFLGFGLGYGPVAYAAAHPDRTIMIIEPDPQYFFAALCLIDWSPVFSCRSCIIALACPAETVITLIEHSGTASCAFFSVPAHTLHAARYFDTVRTLIARNKSKDDINKATLARFSKLWFKNCCRNLPEYGKLQGAGIYEGKAAGIPFTLLAAGPSLGTVLPFLAQIHKKSIIICVDTALRACLSSGTEPDFIIITDPQYYAYRHLAGLSSLSSVLITESAVYPAVSRFPCRKKVMCASLFPIGKWFEQRLGNKGDLGAGGSVSSSAWNFAYLAGSREIYAAGLDLAYPDLSTHIKGSTFEQALHMTSHRTAPAETAGIPGLFSAGIEYGCDYNGKPVATDSRMKMFAWWFESRLAACPDAKTYTFSPEGLAVPGIVPAPVSALLDGPDITLERRQFLEHSESSQDVPSEASYEAALSEFLSKLENINAAALRGKSLCAQALALSGTSVSGPARDSILARLSETDALIKHDELADCIFLFFPAPQEGPQSEQDGQEPDPFRNSVIRSERLCDTVCRAVRQYRNMLRK